MNEYQEALVKAKREGLCEYYIRSSGHFCCNKGIVQVDGRWFCKRHDPTVMEQQREERFNKFRDKIEDERALDLIYRFAPELYKACRAALRGDYSKIELAVAVAEGRISQNSLPRDF